MAPITTATEVNRPAPEVFAYATDPTCFAQWQQGVIEAHLDGSDPPSVGDMCITTRRIGFANRAATAELTHIDPPRTWGVRGIDGPIRATVNVRVDPINHTRSRLTITVDFAGHGIGKVLVPLVVERAARKEMPTNLSALKEHLERAG